MWSVVFTSAEPRCAVAAGLPERQESIGVFLPCAPNPTTGFFFYLPKHEVVEIAITPDEAAKLVMSAGLIHPEDGRARLQSLAEEQLRQRALTSA
jgi:uncharacterized membrane protein